MQSALDETPYLLKALFAALCGVWLWMFFPPMGQLGLVLGIHTFLPVLLVLWVAQLIPSVWARIVLALLAAQAYIVYYFRPAGVVAATVPDVLHQELAEVAPLIHSGQLVEPLQTLLFIFGIIAIYWLLAYASLRPRLWLFYNGLGILVLAIIDGNTNVHPNVAVVVDTLIAFLVMGLSRYSRLRLLFEQFRWPTVRYLAPLLSVMVVSAGVAWILPKEPSAWANPFGNSTFVGLGHGKGGKVQFIGYQESSAQLGGSFVMDNTPVLKVTSSVPVYLRGKVYSDYTGKGWLAGPDTYQPVENGIVPMAPNSTLTAATPTRKITEKIQVLSDKLKGDAVFGAYRVASLSSSAGLGPLNVSQSNGEVTGSLEASGTEYTVVSQAVEDPISQLAALPALPASIAARKSMFSNVLGQADLELPQELPTEVQHLTQQVVGNDTKEYEMVNDISSYLQQFDYQVSNVPVPGPNQDYVDEFLFQTQYGYCNNFSSAMAVMLRTIGIPTRWVTGFAEGQPPNATDTAGTTVDSTGSGTVDTSGNSAADSTGNGTVDSTGGSTSSTSTTDYVVRESNAHSWVEVYFPTYGWIPFDPTPSFSFPYLESSNSSSSGTPVTPPSTPPKPPTNTPVPPPSNGGGPSSTLWHSIGLWTLRIGVTLVGLALLASLVLYKRVLIAMYAWLWKQETANTLTKSMRRLFRLLQKKGWIQRRAFTIRDLQWSADEVGIQREDFQQLVSTVEQAWYGKQGPSSDAIGKTHQTWLQWIGNVIRRKGLTRK